MGIIVYKIQKFYTVAMVTVAMDIYHFSQGYVQMYKIGAQNMKLLLSAIIFLLQIILFTHKKKFFEWEER